MTINNSFLTATRFSITFDDAELRKVEMAILDWPHPAVTRPAARAPSRNQDVPYPGSRYQYEDLQIRVQLDSAMDNYWTLYNWLLSGAEKDVILTAYSSNDKAASQVRYEGAFVESLGGFNFTATDQGDEIVSITVTIKYTRFDRV